MFLRMLLFPALLFGSGAYAQVMQRELGDFELKLATTPTRNMAQGLIQPARSGNFHGGLDLTHANGWYFGQWSPSVGITPGSQLEMDSYVGYAGTRGNGPGYEIGVIRYAYPYLKNADRHEVYAGLTLLGSRLGAALSRANDRADNTLLVDLGQRSPLNLDVTLKYASHSLNNPVSLANGRSVRNYNDWSLNLSRPWLGIRFDLSYSGSDLDNRGGCAIYSGQNAQCNDFLLLKMEHPLY